MNTRIEMRENAHFPGIKVKSGENQYSCHTHIHQAWSFSFVLQGKTVAKLGTWQSEMTEGQFLTIPSGIPHLCSPDAKKPFSFMVLYIPNRYLDSQTVEFSQPGIGEIHIDVVVPILDECLQAETGTQLAASLLKLQQILHSYGAPFTMSWGENLLEQEVKSASAYQHWNRYQLYRYTRKLFGVGQKKLATIEKMEQAKELMNRGWDLIDIALECGYCDQSHFNRVFKRYSGMTPAQYMQKKRTNIPYVKK